MTRLHGWGRYPVVDAQVALPLSSGQCAAALAEGAPLIAHGLGRSYGDSALAPQVLCTRHLDHFQAFDDATGMLTCAAGLSLDTILRTLVPRGWFLPVTPGTRFVTVGGAIASDVHGKNHHVDGTFCAHVRQFDLLLGNGETVTVSPSSHAGHRAAQAHPGQRYHRNHHQGASTYSVAWIDCLARGASLGRSLLMLGEHATDGVLAVQRKPPKPVPFDMPARLLNRATVSAFNALYYGRARRAESTRRIAFEPFFYPLDALANWNRIYGKPGFVQYQFVLPREAGAGGLRAVLERIAESGRSSFLAVLKAFGPANANLLSFPTGGYTLALDFQADAAVLDLLDALDRIVLHHGGRLYLAKDARMSAATFKAGYPRWTEFEETRARWHAHGHFASLQSRRLGLL